MLFLNNLNENNTPYYTTASTSATTSIIAPNFDNFFSNSQILTAAQHVNGQFSTASVFAAAVAAVSLNDECSPTNFDNFLNKGKIF